LLREQKGTVVSAHKRWFVDDHGFRFCTLSCHMIDGFVPLILVPHLHPWFIGPGMLIRKKNA
jgi:hypothetical protein